MKPHDCTSRHEHANARIARGAVRGAALSGLPCPAQLPARAALKSLLSAMCSNFCSFWRNVLTMCFAARKKSNIFQFRLKVENLCTSEVLKEAPGLLRCPVGQGWSC